MSSAVNWIILVVAVLAAVVAVELLRRLLRSRRVNGRFSLAGPIVERCTWPGFATAGLVAFNTGYAPGMSGRSFEFAVQQTITVLLIACVAWLVVQAAYAVTDVVLARLTSIEGAGNRRARRIRTQITLVRRVAAAVIIVVSAGAMLFSFPAVRALGAGLLASAGIAGVVAGIAAQSTLSNLIAGLQLAFSDAIRLDDAVVVDGEWGRIEELTLTYVVVRLWDERRLILPVSYFTATPFENWTRYESRVVGHVLFYVDWSVPVDELRAELYRLLREHPLWDQKDWTLQVTDVRPNGLVELRALMSASDAPSVWDLKCDMREAMIAYVRREHPQALPRFRVEDGGVRPGEAVGPRDDARMIADGAPGGGAGRSTGGGPFRRAAADGRGTLGA
ncbi:mechanosensitive ion channel protein MscS [Sphaerisporangium melleum]|uniref:Mechanosensitive ion channel protein MscS n=1 Tax=Sphaerisporangium melleum TaxID=321316 RepID=A0A917VRM7_9ACTN|nr:mechanosensitive ion channel domain-containing protein [Sphaerisporangium melleum]GGL07582.1 mechanosensitive ion channel protein MscS [Sphaerisporangium melleum]GII68674.1 mechanosensitive ion channel protein MscS [Sphaerisporangium melleum]